MLNPFIFDSHAHYYDPAFNLDRDTLLRSLPQRGVRFVVCPGCDLPSSLASTQLAAAYPFLFAAVGIHPENISNLSLDDLAHVKSLAALPKVVAIGEIGLDYYWLKSSDDRARSRDFFDAQLSLAEQLNLPAIVHDRDAHKDCLDIVHAHPNARGVFHCCALSLQDAKTVVNRGWMLSFTGNITFPNARRSSDILRWLPLDSLMLETDAPYMAPVPFRGQRSDSSMIPLSAAKIASLKNLSTDLILHSTFLNALRFFNIPYPQNDPSNNIP